MTTVAVPDSHYFSLVREGLPEGIDVVVWDPRTPISSTTLDPEAIDVVLFPDCVDAAAVENLNVLPNLRLVQLQSAGYDHVTGHIRDGVAVANGRGVHSDETAEWGVGLALAMLRGLPMYLDQQKERVWRVDTGRDFLAGGRVVVYGAGSIGLELAKRLSTFSVDLHLVATTRRETEYGTTVTFDESRELLKSARVVFLIFPLTPETHGLIDAEFLSRLPDGALVVNIARGGVVDTSALIRECESGRLRAALDVTDPEPLPSSHPLWTCPNVIITPHVAGEQSAYSESIVVRLLEHQIAALEENAELENIVLGA